MKYNILVETLMGGLLMAKDLRDSWKDTGVGLGHAFRDLGKTLVKTGAKAVKKVDAWANKEDYEQEQAQQPEAEAETEAVAGEK